MKFFMAVKKYYLPILLLFLVALTRLPYLIDGVIPFGFDHGKDSLAIMNMLVSKQLTFIGPWTSIPGLYFGPGWYYLLAPFFLFGNFNPVSAVYAMFILVMIQVYLAYKYFGKIAAIIIAGAPFWLMISTSAWNPFPMTLLTLIILIVFKKIREDGLLNEKRALVLSLAAGFGFHFSAAYAIFYFPAVALVLFYLKPKTNIKAVAAGALGLLLPFSPQLLFELRNNFIQTKSVIDYFKAGEPHTFGLDKIVNVIRTTFNDLGNGFLPEFRLLSKNTNRLIKQLVLLSFLPIIYSQIKNKNKTVAKDFNYYLVLFIAFILIPMMGFFFLHFNVWYVYAMIPVMVLLVARIIMIAPKWYQIIFCTLMVLTPVVSYLDYLSVDKAKLLTNHSFLTVKKEAIRTIREKAGAEPFASYHYLPDIYDFSYQYLYFSDALNGKELPVEFAYMPEAVPYIVQKEWLLTQLPRQLKQPDKIFFIVEKPENEEFLSQWWGQQQFGEITETIKINEIVTVYVATP